MDVDKSMGRHGDCILCAILPAGHAREFAVPLAKGVSDPFMKIAGPVSNLVHGRAYGKWEVPRSFDPPSTCALQFWGDALHFSIAQILKLHDQGKTFGIPTCRIYTRSRQVVNPQYYYFLKFAEPTSRAK